MSIGRRQLLKTLGLIGSAAACSGASGATRPASNTEERKRTNILVFMTDDHAQWLQQSYGNTEVRTPNMSRVAQRGVRLTNAFTTSPVCSPARASFFTGRMPSQHGIHDWIEETKQAFDVPWLQGQTLISELLHDAGYHTGLVGKWHCGSEPRPHPGFDFWYSYWVSQYPHVGTQNFSDNGTHVTVDGRQSPLLTKQAIRFLDQHYEERSTAQKPWFLFVGYTDTHNPHESMPPDLVAEYTASTFRDIPSEEIVPAHGKVLTPKRPDAMKEAEQKRQYYAAASAVDVEVGKLLDELEKRGILDDTMVIYTSDHGLNAGQHGLWEKGNATIPQNFLEESIRVPCAVSWPNGGVAQNLECDHAVSHCDLFATILDAANAVPTASTSKQINSPGKSFFSRLRGGSHETASDATFCEYGNARMIRSNGYKLILRFPFKSVTFPDELYDLRADPRETINLLASDHASVASIYRDMKDKADRFFSRYTISGRSGLELETQPIATPASPWLKAVALQQKV